MLKNLLLFLFLLSSSLHGKIYDCFLYYNEWEVLEIRLHELYDSVDKFVLVEASESFRGLPKPFYFEREKHRFTKFLDKIIHIKLDEPFETDSAWTREEYQRNQLIRGLEGCSPEDVIIISDVDEFIPEKIAKLVPFYLNNHPLIGFRNRMFRYFLNREVPQIKGWWWNGLAVTTYGHLIKISPQEARTCVRTSKVPCYVAGWHFTSMGGFERCYEKWENYSHWDNPHPLTYDDWRAEVNGLPLVMIDASFPKFVRKNRDYIRKIGLLDQ